MNKEQTENKQQKSTILLLIGLFFLLNAALLFRAGINTLFFAEDTSGDYSPVQATVTKLETDTTEEKGKDHKIIPIFTFTYKGEELIMAAPDLAFTQVLQKKSGFEEGNEYTLWLHKYRGELILPPIMSQNEMGRSQLLISGVFLLLAIGTWILRNRFGVKSSG